MNRVMYGRMLSVMRKMFPKRIATLDKINQGLLRAAYHFGRASVYEEYVKLDDEMERDFGQEGVNESYGAISNVLKLTRIEVNDCEEDTSTTLQDFIECWEGHHLNCDSLDEGSPRTDCTCGYIAARLKVLEKEDNTHALSEL